MEKRGRPLYADLTLVQLSSCSHEENELVSKMWLILFLRIRNRGSEKIEIDSTRLYLGKIECLARLKFNLLS